MSGLIPDADVVGLGDELKKKRMWQRHIAVKLLQVAWSCQTDLSPLLTPGKAQRGLPRSMAAPSPLPGDAESACSTSPPLGRSLLATSPGRPGFGLLQQDPPAFLHGFKEADESLLWTQGLLKSLESQPGSFLVP